MPKTERECNVCGFRCFTSHDYPCLSYTVTPCAGTMCWIITPLPGKRVSGVLYRDKESIVSDPIFFIKGSSGKNVALDSEGIWDIDEDFLDHTWSLKEWKAQYGKLPCKGSKQAVIIELVSNGK